MDEPAVIAGDMNVCPTDLDVWEPADAHGSTHVTQEERTRLAATVDGGFVDSFRQLHPNEPGYSWWDYRAGHFHKGFGLRIDLVLVSSGLARGLKRAEVVRERRITLRGIGAWSTCDRDAPDHPRVRNAEEVVGSRLVEGVRERLAGADQPESNVPLFAVQVWLTTSLLTTRTVSPTLPVVAPEN